MKKEDLEKQEIRAERFSQPAQFVRILKRPDAKPKEAPVTAMKAVAKPPATFTWKFDRGGPCKRGETAKSSGCIPASKEAGPKREAKPKEAPAPKAMGDRYEEFRPQMETWKAAYKELQELKGGKGDETMIGEATERLDELSQALAQEPQFTEEEFKTTYNGMPATVLEGSTKISPMDWAWWEVISEDPEVQEALAQIDLPPTSDKYMFDTGDTYTDKNGKEKKIYKWEEDRINDKWGKWKDTLPESHRIREDARVKPGKKPRAVIFLGPSGAGKTSKLGKIVDQTGAVIINPDDVKAVMDDPDYNGMNAGVLHNESSAVAGSLAKEAMAIDPETGNGTYNVVFDQTGRDPDKVQEQLEELAKRGYEVEFHLADVPGSESARRVHWRFKNEVTADGKRTMRYVDPRFVMEAVDNNPQRTYEMLKDHPAIKRFSRWNTNQAHNEPAEKIEDECVDPSYTHCSERSYFVEEKKKEEEKKDLTVHHDKEAMEREKARVAAGLDYFDHGDIEPENMYDVSDTIISWAGFQLRREEAEKAAKDEAPKITPMKKKEPLKKPREME